MYIILYLFHSFTRFAVIWGLGFLKGNNLFLKSLSWYR